MNPTRFPSPRHFHLTASLMIVLALFFVASQGHTQANSNEPPASLTTPVSLAANAENPIERSIDIYPALAYDATSQRFLLVWLSLRNAASQNAGFDLYGLFLDSGGQPNGNQFRISDTNNVARSSLPTIAAAEGSFVVGWTQRGATCRLAIQRVSDSSNTPDALLELGLNVHQHSPQLVYNATKQRLLIAFVAGDDYLPPVLSGAKLADVADCGNNASSGSEVRISEFHFDSGAVMIDTSTTLSENAGGTFRPALAFSSGLGHVLVAWEDRRSAADAAYRFDVVAQRLSSDLSKVGANLTLSSGNSYETGDNSATWTPRPSLSAKDSGFLTTWFERSSSGSAETRTVQAQHFDGSSAQPKFEVMRMTFAQSHPGDAPSGFLASVSRSNEDWVAVTSHTESFAGYFSSMRIQRISQSGQLLRLDGTMRPIPSVGDKLDLSLDLQLSLGLAPFGDEIQAVYGKHPTGGSTRDIDIWGSRVLVEATATFTPTATVTSEPTGNTATPTATAIGTATATATSPASSNSSQYLPLVRR